MMKARMTRKAIVAGSRDILSIGYCGAWHLLSNHSPIAYTCGIYGWNFDAYVIDGKTICTGYRNMPGRTPANLGEYEAKAKAIYEDRSVDYADRINRIESLLHEFIEQA